MAKHVESGLHSPQELLNGATGNCKRAFTAFRVRVYKTRTQWKGDTVLEYFAHDSAGFTVEDFKIIDADVQRELRGFLWCLCL